MKTDAKVFFAVMGILLAVFIITFLGNTSFTGNVISSHSRSNCKDVQVPYDYKEEYIDTVPYSDEVCESKELTYNLQDFVIDYNSCQKTEERCLKYILGICSKKETYCVEKKIQCKLDITNLDDQKGYWGVQFEFMSRDDHSTTVGTSKTGGSLYSQETETFYGSKTFYNEEEASKDYTCRYKVTSAPTKLICRDVTKYKDITRTRTVTKYRTEEKCD